MSSAGPGSEKKPETSPGANPAAAADAKTSLRDFSGLIALIGAGKMGGALLQGWLRLGLDPRKVIVIEPQALPYLSALATQYGVATNYHAVASPSLPNYLALTSGETFGIEDDDFHPLPPGGIGEQLSAAGITWRAYMEGMGQDCRTDTETYVVKHDPFAFYGPTCPAFLSSVSTSRPSCG